MAKRQIFWYVHLLTVVTAVVAQTWHQFEGYEYYIEYSKVSSYAEAESGCATSNANVANVKTTQVFNFLVGKINVTDFPFAFYIGATRITGTNKFRWTDGTSVDVAQWSGAQEPNNHGGNENCVMMGWIYEPDSTFRWRDVACSHTSRYICQKSSPATSTTTITKPTTTSTTIATTRSNNTFGNATEQAMTTSILSNRSATTHLLEANYSKATGSVITTVVTETFVDSDNIDNLTAPANGSTDHPTTLRTKHSTTRDEDVMSTTPLTASDESSWGELLLIIIPAASTVAVVAVIIAVVLVCKRRRLQRNKNNGYSSQDNGNITHQNLASTQNTGDQSLDRQTVDNLLYVTQEETAFNHTKSTSKQADDSNHAPKSNNAPAPYMNVQNAKETQYDQVKTKKSSQQNENSKVGVEVSGNTSANPYDEIKTPPRPAPELSATTNKDPRQSVRYHDVKSLELNFYNEVADEGEGDAAYSVVVEATEEDAKENRMNLPHDYDPIYTTMAPYTPSSGGKRGGRGERGGGSEQHIDMEESVGDMYAAVNKKH